MTFWAYMLHCKGGVFYVGHTDNLEARIEQHKSGRSGYTRQYLPVELVWSQEFASRLEALEAERRMKGWGRPKKLALISGDWDMIAALAKKKNGPSTSSGRTDGGGAFPLPVRAELVEAPLFSSGARDGS